VIFTPLQYLTGVHTTQLLFGEAAQHRVQNSNRWLIRHTDTGRCQRAHSSNRKSHAGRTVLRFASRPHEYTLARVGMRF
jgi:hypothetical protein